MAATPSTKVLLWIAAAFVGACATATRVPASPSHEQVSDAGTYLDAAEEADSATDATTSAENEPDADAAPSPCPRNMVLVDANGGTFCIDVFEASLVEIDADGNEKPFPHWLPVDGHSVRAVSEPGVFPQGFISEVQADDACAAAGKRLCSYPEWKTACTGPSRTTFPYGNERRPGTCHDTGKSAVFAVFGTRAFTDPVATAPTKKAPPKKAPPRSAKSNTKGPAHITTKGRAAETVKQRAPRPKNEAATTKRKAVAPAKKSARPAAVEASVWAQLNDPRLGQVDGALSKTGSHEACESGFGTFDMVGNIHEWVKTDASIDHGTFAGGYYLDTAKNGDGCNYRTTAHAHDYHDYSTGFRCCAAPEGPSARK